MHKLQLFLFNGASRANCRAQRPRRPALAEGTLAEGNMSPMTRFLLGDSNLCRGELRSSVWFTILTAAGRCGHRHLQMCHAANLREIAGGYGIRPYDSSKIVGARIARPHGLRNFTTCLVAYTAASAFCEQFAKVMH